MPRALKVPAALFVIADVAAACGDGGTPQRGVGDGAGEQAADRARCEDVDLSRAPDRPTTIRFGHGAAAEEQVWLMAAEPEITEHQGTWYELEPSAFRGNEERFVAYQAGELDALTVSAPTLVRAVAQRIGVKAVVTVTRESAEGFRTTFLALEDSGISDAGDLSGKKIGIVDIGSATEYWAKSGVAAAGLDPERDVEYVVLPFPAQGEALRNGQIDAAVMVEPFYTMAHQGGGVVDVFDSLDGPGFDQELILFAFDNGFREENPEVVCAWIEDFQTATDWYEANTDEAKKVLAEGEWVRTPVEIYTRAGDWLHPDGGVVDVEGLDRLVDSMIEFGVLDEDQRVAAEEMVAVDFAPAEGG
ncbi:MAG: ABC transporter substrate-binding protein [Acidimicrobiales bacterium]